MAMSDLTMARGRVKGVAIVKRNSSARIFKVVEPAQTRHIICDDPMLATFKDTRKDTWIKDAWMTKRNKTAPELEMLIYQRMQSHAVCHGVTAVTVEEGKGPGGSNWVVSDIHVPSGAVPPAVRDICDDAADDLRTQYDLMTEYELGEDESL